MSLGYDHRWAKYARAFRSEFPLCGMTSTGVPTGDSRCQMRRRVSPAQCVDHIVPICGPNDPRFYDRSNHQSLCNSCHAVKRQRESMEARRP
jgi:5-methylcytosine-specific restriction protein A